MVEGVGRVSKNGVPDGTGTETGAAAEGQCANQEKRLIRRKPEEQHVGEASLGETQALWGDTAEFRILAALQSGTLQKQLLALLHSVCETCKSSGVLAQPVFLFTVLDQLFPLSRPSHLEGGGGFALSVAKSDHLRDS